VFEVLCQPLADGVEQRILLRVDLTAGMVIGPPGLLTPGFKRTHYPLPLQLLGQGGRQADGLLRVLECLIQQGLLAARPHR